MTLSMRTALEKVRQADHWLADHEPVPFHVTSHGLEAVITGGMLGIERSDWVFPGLRERVGAVLRDCPQERLIDGHAGARPYRIAPVSTSAGTRLLHACGMAATLDNDSAVLCFIGQGSAATGSFHEALNIAAQQKLRVIFLCHTWNLEHPESPLPPQLSGSLSAKGLAYGLQTNTIDGGLITEVLHAVSDARSRPGPSLIEARITPGEDPIERAYSELTETDPATGESAIA